MDEENQSFENEGELTFEFNEMSPDESEKPLSDETVQSGETPTPSETSQLDEPAVETVSGEMLLELMNRLLVEFQGKLKYDAKKQEQIDRLYDENVALKNGLFEAFKKQLILGVIERIDMAERNLAGFRSLPFSEENYQALISATEELPNIFQEMLTDRFDVLVWQSDEGSAFEPSRQHILRTVPTSDQSKNKTLAGSIRRGYRTEEGTILRPELVDVYLYHEPQPSEEE